MFNRINISKIINKNTFCNIFSRICKNSSKKCRCNTRFYNTSNTKSRSSNRSIKKSSKKNSKNIYKNILIII